MAGQYGSAPNWAHVANNVPSQLGVIGTLGTADIAGTALTLPMAVDATTGAQYVMLVGTSAGGTSSLQVAGGTLQNLVSGTVNAGTIFAGFAELTGSVTAGTTDIIASTDISAYRQASLQLLNTWVGTVNVQVSDDNSNFINALTWNVSNTGAPNATLSANGVYDLPIKSRYLRVRMNAFTSGTAQAVLELNSQPSMLQNTVVTAIQSGAWNVTGTIATGSIAVSYPTFTYVSAAATQTIKSGAGVLHTVTVGSLLGAGTLFNSAGTSANVIWSVITPSPQTFHFDCQFGSLTWAGTGAENVTIVSS